MQDLNLVKQENFNSVQCDFYQGEDDFYMTRQQIGEALEYNQPRQAIHRIHEQHKERLDKYSVVYDLTTTDGKTYSTILYSRKGVFEICRWSRQPKADAFMDWAWDILDKLMSGYYKIQQIENKNQEIENRIESDLLELRWENLEECEEYLHERELKLKAAELLVKEKVMKRCHLWLLQ